MSPKLPALTARDLIVILRKHGFTLDRQSGSYAIFNIRTGEEQQFPFMENEI
jgi:predicted RNA binding protein YcfA (HicA-like mRNA interferase family)